MTALFNIIRNHWFKIAIAAMFGLFFLKKEISFQINMRNRETPKKEEIRTGRYTENHTEDDKLSLFNMMDLLPSGKSLKTAFEETSFEDKVAFVKRFGKVARDEQAKFGIPASLILAEAMLQSNVGTRDLAKNNNNYFALPCGKHWKSETTTEGTECYRSYGSAWESFRDHSEFVNKSLDAPKTHNYKVWINAFSEAFGTKDEYAQLLIEIIEEYDLHLLDK